MKQQFLAIGRQSMDRINKDQIHEQSPQFSIHVDNI